MVEGGLPYAGCGLERAATSREDPKWLDSLTSEAASLLPFWRDRCVVDQHGVPIRATGGPALRVVGAATCVAFLGRDGDRGFLAADLSSLPEARAVELCGGEAVIELRKLARALPARDASILAYARGLLHWHRNQQFCGACGATSVLGDGGHSRRCSAPGCGRQLFPRIEPCVIVLVESAAPPRRCLLGRHNGAAEGVYSTLAGFVEVGESLEDAVRREVREEAGVVVGEVRYFGSQPWPFPSALMIGFRARAIRDEISVDREELVEARWFDERELAALAVSECGSFNEDSIERSLIEQWMRESLPPKEMT